MTLTDNKADGKDDLREPLFEGDAVNRREDWEIEKEDCWCCNNGHPTENTFYDNYDESGTCFDCNFDNCQKPAYWMALIDADRKKQDEVVGRLKHEREVFRVKKEDAEDKLSRWLTKDAEERRRTVELADKYIEQLVRHLFTTHWCEHSSVSMVKERLHAELTQNPSERAKE